MVRVKICGLSDTRGVDAAVEAGADWLGFNFFRRSPRVVTAEAVAHLAGGGRGGPVLVGLFVEPEDAAIEAALRAAPFGALQLYASAARVAEIGRRFGVPVWRSVHVRAPADLPGMADADGFVIEAPPPAGAARPGGNAVAFDWAMLAGWQAPAPWMLAGGLRPDNVAAAVRQSGAAAVDVASGVESTPGVKSPALIRAFIQAARATAGSGAAAPA